MPVWSETQFKVEIKDFEDGLNDVRCNTVDEIAYEINREYRRGVEIASQLITRFDATRRQVLNNPIKPADIAAKLNPSEKALGLV